MTTLPDKPEDPHAQRNDDFLLKQIGELPTFQIGKSNIRLRPGVVEYGINLPRVWRVHESASVSFEPSGFPEWQITQILTRREGISIVVDNRTGREFNVEFGFISVGRA